MPVASFIPAIITGGTSIAGAVIAGNASKKAAQSVAGAEQANIDLAREERAKNEQLFAPEIERGNRADAYLDALTYGVGEDRAAAAYAPTGGPDWAAYLQQNPDVARGAAQAGWDPIAYAQYHYATYGQNEGRALPTIGSSAGAGGTVSRDDALAALYNTPLSQYNEQDLAARGALADDAYTGETDLEDSQLSRVLATLGAQRGEGDTIAGAKLDDLLASYGAQRGQAYDVAGAKRDDLTGLNSGRYLDQDARIAQGLGDRFALADAAYGAARGTADENYGATNDLLDTQYLKRQGLTDQEIADYQAQAGRARDDTLDQLASRYGLTGQTGRAQRSVAETNLDYALENAQYADQKRGADYNTYATGQGSALDARGAAYTAADLARSGRRDSAYDAYYTDTGANLDDYYGGQTAIDAGYYGDIGGADAAYFSGVNPALSGYYDTLGTNAQGYYDDLAGAYSADEATRLATLQRRNLARSSAYDAYASGRATALDDFLTRLQSNSQRGITGRGNIAAAGQSTLGVTADSNSRAAAAYAQNAINSGNVWNSALDQVGKGVSDAWADFQASRKSSTTSSKI
jgi:hypothetical protein